MAIKAKITIFDDEKPDRILVKDRVLCPNYETTDITDGFLRKLYLFKFEYATYSDKLKEEEKQ